MSIFFNWKAIIFFMESIDVAKNNNLEWLNAQLNKIFSVLGIEKLAIRDLASKL